MNKNRIEQVFVGKQALICFITGGDPDIETTEKLIVAMAEAGADMIEIGIPFSDPVAEGLVIQAANARALENGCTVDELFAMVKRVRGKVAIPLLFMTYMNPVFVYGKERFMKKCQECGIDGIIVPDLPFEEKEELADVCKQYEITPISMIAPTSEDRIEKIAKEAQGFLYCVSSLGVTGLRSEIKTNVKGMIEKVRRVSKIPCAVGFGISTPEQAKEMLAVTDGVIVGSAIVKVVAEYGKESVEKVEKLLREIKRVF
ncbi:MAG: tryptophan synthase subunit alpha [Lachnospiraceae bacterium]|nr:tryptophan synthase subunit alpha [Lachnospiraceae bacterium]